MEIYDKQYADFESLSFQEQLKLRASELVVRTSAGNIPMLDLFVIDKKGNARNVNSIADFKLHLNKGMVYVTNSGDGQLDNLDSPILYKSINVPETIESTEINSSLVSDTNKIPNGLKRTLGISPADYGDGEYLYVFIDGKGKFLPKDKIFWYDGLVKKTYNDAISEGKDLSTIEFVDEFNKDISGIYTEHEYKIGVVLAREKINLTSKTDAEKIPAYTKQTYSVDKKNNFKYTLKPLDKYVTDQEYVKKEVDNERRPGKKKTISLLKTKNYYASSTGEYVGVTFDKDVQIVKISDLVDKEGNPIENITDFVGKTVCVKKDDETLIETKPLTYEQANLKYDVLKTFQKSSEPISETSCIKLANGQYVQEKASVQPISFKLATDEDHFDKYLVPILEGGVEKYVLIDKDYVEKRGSTLGMDLSRAKKVVECDFNDKNCVAVQKTSKKQKVEQCSLVKKVKFGDDLISPEQNKLEAYNEFKVSYENGEYQIDSVYVDGAKIKIEEGRFEYSDESYHTDYASNLSEYKAMKTKNISIKDGKIVGGAKYDAFDGMADAYAKWGKALLAGITIVPFAGVMGVLAVPLVSAYAVGVLAAAPLIPVVELVKAANKNNPLKKFVEYADKTEYNRQKEYANMVSKLKNVLKSDKAISYSDFEEVLLNITNDIATFAKTTNNNSLVVVDGKAEVNENNANLANQYVAEYKKAKKKFDAVDKRVQKLTKAGKPIPAELQEEYDKRKAELEGLKNVTRGQSYEADSRIEDLQNKAAAVKLIYYIENFKDAELVSSLSEELKTKLKCTKNLDLEIDDISIFEDEEKVKKAFKNSDSKFEAWKALRNEALVAIEKAKTFVPKEPIAEDVEGKVNAAQEEQNKKLEAMNRLQEIKTTCAEISDNIKATIESISDEYQIKGATLLLAQQIVESLNESSFDFDEETELGIIETIMTKAEQKLESIKELEIRSLEAKSLIEKAEETVAEFTEIENNIKNICNGIDGDSKTKILGQLKAISNNVLAAQNKIKAEETNKNWDPQLEILIDGKNQAQELLNEILEKNKELSATQTLTQLQTLYERASYLISKLNSTKVKTSLASVVLILNNNKRIIKELQNDVEKGKELSEPPTLKSNLIVMMIDVGVDALMVLEQIIDSKNDKSKTKVAEAFEDLSVFLRVTKDMPIQEIKENLARAKILYETRILPYLVEMKKEKVKADKEKTNEKTKQKSKEKLYDPKMNSEDDLRDLLINRDENLISYLESNGVDCNDQNIIETINRIDDKHKIGKNATANATQLSNKEIAKILVYGQRYITECLKKGVMTSV